MNVIIRGYRSTDRPLIEDFREKTFIEGNDSLTVKKYNPDNLIGQTFLFFIDNDLSSISVVESSIKYTQEDNTARICRYHILKKYRHCNAGFQMLPYNVGWAIENNYKLIYWTHDVSNRALNAMYQHKRRMPNKKEFFEDPLYKSFEIQPNLRFITGDVTQYVYAKKLDAAFVWSPKGNMIANL
jgi:hypothetical protein